MKTMKLMLICAALLAVTPSWARIVVLKSPDGKVEKIKKVKLQDKKVRREIENLGVDLYAHRELCREAAQSKISAIRQEEIRLELGFMVQSLRAGRNSRRELTQSQQEQLYKIPACEPYLQDLLTIARLKKGWNLVKVED